MPLVRKDADRGLELLWEFHNEAEDDGQRAAYVEAISSLHSYLTDLLPAGQPSLRAKVKGGFVELYPHHETPVKCVQLNCGDGDKLGVFIDSVCVSESASSGEISPFVVTHIIPGSAADREGSLRRGDQLVEVDSRPLTHVSLERARWLLDSAERRGMVRITMLPLGLVDSLKHLVSQEDLSIPSSLSDGYTEGYRETERQRRPRDSRKRTALHDIAPKGYTKRGMVEEGHLENGLSSFEETVGKGSLSLASSLREGSGNDLTRGDSLRSSGTFPRRKVRKMHIMKGAHGLGLRIIGGKGSKHGNIGIFIRDIDLCGAAHSDGRLKPGDEILMVDGKSLVGLTHSEAVGVLKMTQQLVQLVVATEVSADQSITSSLASIPDWAKNSAPTGPPPLFSSSSPHSLSPLSTGFIEGGLDITSPEFNIRSPHEFTFGAGDGHSPPGGEGFELMRLSHMMPKSAEEEEEGVRVTGFTPSVESHTLQHGEGRLEVQVGDDTALDTEVVDIVLDKPVGKSLGFTVCRGSGAKDGIFVRAINPTGLAGREGSLREGDQLLEANGRTLTGLTHKESANLIRGLNTDRVILRVCRTVIRKLSRTPSMTSGSSTTEVGSSSAVVAARLSDDMESGPHSSDPPSLDLPPPPPPPDSSEGSTDHESPPPSPPHTPPPTSAPGDIVGPPTSPPPLPISSGEQQDSETETEEDKVKKKKQAASVILDTQTSEDGENFGQLRHEHASAVVGAEKLEEFLVKDDSGNEVEGRNLMKNKQAALEGKDSDIEVRGHLNETDPGSVPHGMASTPTTMEPGTYLDNIGGRKTDTDVGEEETGVVGGQSPSREPDFSKGKVEGTRGKAEGEGEHEDGPPMGFQRLVLQMKKRANSGLGVTIVHGLGKTKGIYMIRRIMAGGVAARDKRVKPGDRLVAINGKSLCNLSHAEVLQTINEAPKEIQLEIWHDPDFELDTTSSIYSIGSRSSVLSDEDTTDDSLSQRHSLASLERVARDGRWGRGSPRIGRYSASMVDQLADRAGHDELPRISKRWSTIVLSPNAGPLGESLSTPPPPPTSPTHPLTPPNPLPSPNTLSPSSVPLSLSPSPEHSSSPPPHNGHNSPPPSPPSLNSQAPISHSPPSLHSQTPISHTPLHPQVPTSQPPLPSLHSQDDNDGVHQTPPSPSSHPSITARSVVRNEVERPKSLGPVPRGARLEHRPFEIEVTKGIFGLGLNMRMGNVGMIVVQSLSSRSPIRKDGNIRVGDHLLSINDTSLIGVDIAAAEMIVKGLPRGVVRIVAMAPPKDVTGSGLKCEEESRRRESPPSHPPPLPSTPPPLPSSPPPTSLLPEVTDEPGIIRAKLQRFGNAPLGLVLEGGCDSPQKYIFIQSITFGSVAFNCGQFMCGDQLVMVGKECLIGMSLQQAKLVLEQAPSVVELVAQRKESVNKESPPLQPRTEVSQELGRERETEEDKKQNVIRREEEELTGDQDRVQPQFSWSASRTDVYGSGTSTSLGYSTNLNTSWNLSMSGRLHSKTTSIDNLQGSVDSLRDDVLYHQSSATPTSDPSRAATEEQFVVELRREEPHKLGLSIVGGADNPSLQTPHVKRVLPDGLVHRDGRITRGDRIVSVNGCSLTGLTNKEALQVLKASGNVVTLILARRIGRRGGSQVASPFHSQLQSRHSSGENTHEPPSPVMGNHHPTSRQRRDSSGSEGAPPTPPSGTRSTSKGRSRRESLSREGEDRGKPVTMPRKLKSTEGVKIVELHKGPTGLGMNLKGGSDENLPITVREVFPGGTAHKSGKIHPGDVILEVNNDSFETLTHKEALQKLKSYPQGKISLLVRDRTAMLPRKLH